MNTSVFIKRAHIKTSNSYFDAASGYYLLVDF